MIHHVLRSLLGLSVLLFAFACGDDDGGGGGSLPPPSAGCSQYCASTIANGCQLLDMDTCEQFCSVFEVAANHTGCRTQYDAQIDCQNGSADVCAPDCATEQAAFESCQDAFCAANPGDELCGDAG